MDYSLFIEWLSQSLNNKSLSDDIVAFCFNLYESDDDCQFDIQLVGCSQFDSEEDDWACSVTFTTGENLFPLEASNWENALETFATIITKAVECASLKDIFKNKHIAYGFVDGDLYIVR